MSGRLLGLFRCGFPLGLFPFGLPLSLSAFCSGGGGGWMSFALHSKKTLCIAFFLLPSVFSLTLFILRALYPLYTAALRNLREFERAKNDFLKVIHISKTKRL